MYKMKIIFSTDNLWLCIDQSEFTIIWIDDLARYMIKANDRHENICAGIDVVFKCMSLYFQL